MNISVKIKAYVKIQSKERTDAFVKKALQASIVRMVSEYEK